MYICMHVCMYVCMYACMYPCMYVFMYVCMYVYMYVLAVSVNILFQPPPPLQRHTSITPINKCKYVWCTFSIALYNLPVRRSLYVLNVGILTGARQSILLKQRRHSPNACWKSRSVACFTTTGKQGPLFVAPFCIKQQFFLPTLSSERAL
jgi:hypothetical protein